MDFEVDTDELKYVEKKLYSTADLLNEQLDYWKEHIERLKLIWTGEDATIFYMRIDEYLLKLKMLSETTNVFGKALNKSYTLYEEKDREFSKELSIENDQYDDTEMLSKGGFYGNTYINN